MRASSLLWRGSAALVVAVFLAGTVAAAPVGEDAAMREKVLKLNEITGKLPLEGQIKELVDKPDDTKKLLVVAVKMAGEKDQPLNVNATYILAHRSTPQRVRQQR